MRGWAIVVAVLAVGCGGSVAAQGGSDECIPTGPSAYVCAGAESPQGLTGCSTSPMPAGASASTCVEDACTRYASDDDRCGGGQARACAPGVVPAGSCHDAHYSIEWTYAATWWPELWCCSAD